ncbi:MAG: hypothetical protein ACOX3T_03160 [Bdellovibrionota bacterium]
MRRSSNSRYSRDDRGSRGSRDNRYFKNSRRDSRYSSRNNDRYSSNRKSHNYNRGRRGDANQADAGNKRERIAVESGALVLIDQFMLANPQFIQKMLDNIDEDVVVKDKIVRDYGGEVIDIAPDTYGIQRDPYALSIIIHPSNIKVDKNALSKEENAIGNVFVDTRCIAMVDRELLDDNSLLKKYQELWEKGEDKACRDLLRDNGGAVRYGFCRYGDEFNVYVNEENNIVSLLPGAKENANE